MLLRIIENIRQKPKASRQHYAFVTAVVFTAIVAGVWSFSLPTRFASVQTGVVTASPEVTGQTAGVPFSGVWAEFKKQVSTGFGDKADSTLVAEPTNDTGSSVTEDKEAVANDEVLLESGSTIRFGTQTQATATSAVILDISSSTSSTSVVEP